MGLLQWNAPPLEFLLGGYKGEALVQTPGTLEPLPVAFFYHLEYGCLRSVDGGRSLPQVDSCRTQALCRKVVGAGGSPLHFGCDNGLPLHLLHRVGHKHGDIRTNCICDGVNQGQLCLVGIVHAHNRAVVSPPDVDGAAVGVGEGDDSLFDVVGVDGFEFSVGVFV